MAREYSPKTNPLTSNRLLKIIKDTVESAKKEEKLVKDTYDYFHGLVEEESTDSASKSAMVDCLKILQNSKVTISKLVTTAAKINADQNSGKSSPADVAEDFFENIT